MSKSSSAKYIYNIYEAPIFAYTIYMKLPYLQNSIYHIFNTNSTSLFNVYLVVNSILVVYLLRLSLIAMYLLWINFLIQSNKYLYWGGKNPGLFGFNWVYLGFI